jgi:hypothetical protein
MKMAAATLMLAAASCGEEGKLNIRSLPSPLAAGEHAVSFRVAEARAQYALGNVALALEGYRKALRDDPQSVDALGGLAACYDQMGRFDLSRRYHESALALAPQNTQLYADLAASLTLQGQTEEAASVRAEMAQRFAVAAKPAGATSTATPSESITQVAASAPVATQPERPIQPLLAAITPVPAATPTPAVSQAPPVPSPPVAARSVTIALPPPRPIRQAAIAPVRSAPHLERLSLGEVALVTSSAPLWRAQLVERSSRSATIGFRPLAQTTVRVANVILLNAARSQGLAARTKTYLSERGWSRIAIGDAPRVLGASTIIYPASRRATAVRLANQFGFALRHKPSDSGALTIMLGRDAARNGMLRAARG